LQRQTTHIIAIFGKHMGFHANMRIVITPHHTVVAVYFTAQMETSSLSAFQVKVVKLTGDTGLNPEQASL
jgi:hypothetical protein